MPCKLIASVSLSHLMMPMSQRRRPALAPLTEVPIGVTIRLGSARLTLGELMELRAGRCSGLTSGWMPRRRSWWANRSSPSGRW